MDDKMILTLVKDQKETKELLKALALFQKKLKNEELVRPFDIREISTMIEAIKEVATIHSEGLDAMLYDEDFEV